MTSHFKDFYHNILLARMLFEDFLINESKKESKYEFGNAIVKCKMKNKTIQRYFKNQSEYKSRYPNVNF